MSYEALVATENKTSLPLRTILDMLRSGSIQQFLIYLSVAQLSISSVRKFYRAPAETVVPAKNWRHGHFGFGILAFEITALISRMTSVTPDTKEFWSQPNAILLAYATIIQFASLITTGEPCRLLETQASLVAVSCWLITMTTDVLPFLLVDPSYNSDNSTLSSALALSFAILTVGCCPRGAPVQPKKRGTARNLKSSPEETCSWIDRFITFGRMSPIILKGWKEDVVLNNLGDLPRHLSPSIVRQHWIAAKAKYRTTARSLFALLWLDIGVASLYGSLFFGTELLVPFGLYHLLEDLGEPKGAVLKPQAWLAVIFAGQILPSIMQQQYTFTSNRIGIKIKAALTTELFHTTLASSEVASHMSTEFDSQRTSSPRISTAGQMSNLVSMDISTIMGARVIMMMAAGIPTGCLVALVGLYGMVGWPCLVGLAIMALGSTITAWLVGQSERQQDRLKDAQDTRISVASEYLHSVQIVKYFGWEETVLNLLNDIRSTEQHHLRKVHFILAAINETSYCIPALALLVVFALYVYIYERPLTASVAYSTVFLFEMVRDNFVATSTIAMMIPKLRTSLKRLDRHFASRVKLEVYPDRPLRITAATFRRTQSATFCLDNITVNFVYRGLNVVTGPSASGKTTLLLAILGEICKEKGEVCKPSDVAYASQSPWLQAVSIRDNIVFNSIYDEDKYRAIVKACCLDTDMETLPAKDATYLGESGTTLSGGQRARIALARALYSDAPLILIDDIFSALDSKTTLKLWNHVFCTSLLHRKTVVLVTQLTWVASEANLSIELAGGLVKHVQRNMGRDRKPKDVQMEEQILERNVDNGKLGAGDDIGGDLPGTLRSRATSAVLDQPNSTNRLLFMRYIQYFGDPVATLGIIATLVVSNLAALGTAFWMTNWVDNVDESNSEETKFYLGVYTCMSIISTAAEGFAFWAFMRGSWNAAGRLHSTMVAAVFHAPLSWFRNISVGSIISRFSEDMDGLDQEIADPLTEFCDQVVKVLLLGGSITAILPIFSLPAVVLAGAGGVIGEIYSHAAVATKRLTSANQSRILSQISESMRGLAVIRAREKIPDIFVRQLDQSLNDWAKASATQSGCDSWLRFRLNFLAALINVSAGALAISRHDKLSASILGLSLTKASEFSAIALRMVFKLNDINLEMQGFRRIEEYCQIPPEETSVGTPSAPNEPRSTPLAEWPQSGSIELRNVTVRYGSNDHDILRNISLKIHAGERVAIVGRTGSGKSTLLLSLLRFTRIVSGTILYDGQDITRIPYKTLRRAIATIPQEAALFQGTVASNLDPTKTVPESVLQSALDICKPLSVMNMRQGCNISLDDNDRSGEETDSFRGKLDLSTAIETAGHNFSHGQRQVLSLCRLLSRNASLMLLDEATSSMDAETDMQIQNVLRERMATAEYRNRVLITVAHRLSTITDYDKVVVMANGKIVEVGSPDRLIAKKGAFYSLLQHTQDGTGPNFSERYHKGHQT